MQKHWPTHYFVFTVSTVIKLLRYYGGVQVPAVPSCVLAIDIVSTSDCPPYMILLPNCALFRSTDCKPSSEVLRSLCLGSMRVIVESHQSGICIDNSSSSSFVRAIARRWYS